MKDEGSWQDGFWPHGGKLYFEGKPWPDRKPVWYLHGALHLYTTMKGVYKHSISGQQKPLTEIISEAIADKMPPLFVAEGEAQKKMRAIQNNPYLMVAMSSFARQSGDLVVYGHSLSSEDSHIKRAIGKNASIRKVFLGVYNDEDLYNKIAVRNYFTNNGKEVVLYNMGTCDVWGG